MPGRSPSASKMKKLKRIHGAPLKRNDKSSSSRFYDLLKSSLESVDEGILVVDLKGKIIFHNSNFLKLWSIPEELAAKNDDNLALQFVLDQIADPVKFMARVTELYQSLQEESLDEIGLKDGRIFKRFSKAHFHGKKIVGRVWSFRDVTEEKSRERNLLDWRNRYELVVASFGRVVYDYDLPSGNILWSGNILGVLGYTPDEMGDIDAWGSLIHEEDRGPAFASLEEAQKKLSKYEVTYRFKTKNNGYIWLRDTGFFIPDEHQVANRMLGEMEDITRQIQTEQEIRHLASFPLHNPEIVIEVKRNLMLNYANPSFYESVRRLGLTDHYPFITDETRKMANVSTPWKITADVQVGRRVFNEKIYYLAEKELIRIYAYDITERLEVEKRISDLELTYKTLFENATDCILIISLDDQPGRIISANPAAAEIHGYSLQEFLTLNLKDIDHQGISGISFDERANQLMSTSRQNFEVVHYKKNGELIPLEVVASVIEVSGKRYLLSVERDISSRKKAEEEIQLQYRFIESLAAASPDIVYVYDLDEDKYLYANQHMADSYGYPVERLKAEGHKLMVTMLDPEDVAKIPEWTSRLRNARDNEVVESQFRLRGHDGSWRTFRCREAVFMRDDKGRVKQFIGSANDITDRVSAEKALRESEERFRALHEAMFAGIAIHDKGIIVECNTGLSVLTGYAYEELIGFDTFNFIHPDDRATCYEKMMQGDEIPYDLKGIRKDGSVYELEIHGKAIPYKGLILRITEFRDITERKKAAEKILEQNARLMAITNDLKFKNEQLDEFTQIVSHNLRSPAGNIVSLTKFMQGSPQNSDQQELLKLLKDSGDTILQTLSELNEVLKIKQDKTIEKQHLEFEKVLSKTMNMLNAHIAETGAIIDHNFSESPTILYPNIYLESIVLNLLSNALKYRHPGRQPYVKFMSRNSNEGVILEVTDNGLGINLERYKHQLFKLRKTFHKHPDSRGIGLFMIKNQIEAMGGKISVQSEEGEGSTFKVTF